MRRARTRTSGRTTKLVLILLGLVSFSGAIALAERSGLSFSPVAKGQGGAPSNPTRALSIRVAPAVRTVAPGDVAKFRIRIRRHSPTAGDAGPEGMQRHKRRIVRLGTLGGLPRGATAAFRPKRTRSPISTLIVKTSGVPRGQYRIRIHERNRRTLAHNRTRHAIGLAHLIIRRPQAAGFTISGDATSPLAPGLAVPLDLTLANPGPSAIAISGLNANVTGVSAPNSGATRPCTVDDFAVTPFSGAYGFALASGRTTTLSQLGIPAEQWPQLTMLDRPVNQDGCKGASLTLSYSGTSTKGDA